MTASSKSARLQRRRQIRALAWTQHLRNTPHQRIPADELRRGDVMLTHSLYHDDPIIYYEVVTNCVVSQLGHTQAETLVNEQHSHRKVINYHSFSNLSTVLILQRKEPNATKP